MGCRGTFALKQNFLAATLLLCIFLGVILSSKILETNLSSLFPTDFKKTTPNFTVVEKDWLTRESKSLRTVETDAPYCKYKETWWLYYIAFSGPVKKNQKA